MDLSALSSWASTCSNTLVTLSIATQKTTSSSTKTNIVGDRTSTSLFYLTGILFVRFSMMNVAVMGFGDGSAAFPGAVYLDSLLGATFGPNVQFGPNNVGYSTSGALVVYSLPSLVVISSIFAGNSAVVQSDFSTIWASGGALSIFSSNSIVISKTTFVNNSITGGFGNGGALYVEASNNVTISGCSIEGNSIAGGGGYGGALLFYSSNAITVTSCSMVNNSVTGGGGQGGALAFTSSNTITLTSCSIKGNNVNRGSGYGGALFFSSSNTITMTSCSIGGNSVTGGSGYGGALSFLSSNTITVTSCSIEGNSVTGGKGQGGALYFQFSNIIAIASCSIEGNNNVGGSGSGGALYFYYGNTITLTSCSIEGNSVTGGGGYGGALSFLLSNTITVASCSIVGNSNTGGKGNGGALYFDTSKTITVTSCSIVDNSNVGGGGKGGAVDFFSSKKVSVANCTFRNNIVAGDGGAIYIDTKSSFIGFTAVRFSRNVASSGAGGAVYVGASCSYLSFGGPMPMLETCVGLCDQASNVDANGFGHSNSLVQEPRSLHVVGYYVVFDDVGNNVFTYAGENTIVGDYAYTTSGLTAPGVNGEAPYLFHGSIMTINNTRYNDIAEGYASLWVFPFSALSTVFDRNVASTYGGAIYIGNSVNNVFVMPGTVFTGNTVSGSGGAVFLASLSTKIYLYSTMFQNNNASTNGGAVAFEDNVASVQFYSCSFVSNSAQYGGGVYFDTANGIDFTNTGLVNVIEIVNMTMRHNFAAVDGGGIYANNLNVFSLLSSVMVDNVAGRAGGAIAMNTINTMSISTSFSFVHNSAGTDGGAIHSKGNNTFSSLFGSTVTFSRNTCMGRGGALAMNAGSIVTFDGTTTFDSNYAQRQGGAIAVSASSLVLGPSVITFIKNSALSGSAMYLTSSSTSSVDIVAPSFGSGCTNQTTCTIPPGHFSQGYITYAYYGKSGSSSGCNNVPLALYVHELGVCTSKGAHGLGGNGVYSMIPSTTGAFPQLFFEQYESISAGTKRTIYHDYYTLDIFLTLSFRVCIDSLSEGHLCIYKLSSICECWDCQHIMFYSEWWYLSIFIRNSIHQYCRASSTYWVCLQRKCFILWFGLHWCSGEFLDHISYWCH